VVITKPPVERIGRPELGDDRMTIDQWDRMIQRLNRDRSGFRSSGY
jgi:hypothetical protein